MSTYAVENIFSRFNDRFRLHKDVAGILRMAYEGGSQPFLIQFNQLSQIVTDINEAHMSFLSGSTEFLANDQNNDYETYIIYNGIVNTLDSNFAKIDKIFRNVDDKAERWIIANRDKYNSSNETVYKDIICEKTVNKMVLKWQNYDLQFRMQFSLKTVKAEMCQCGTRTTIYPEESRMKCDSCGKVTPLYGTIFDDSQSFTQHGQSTKSKKFEFQKHCNKCLNNIQAKPVDVPDEIIDIVDKKAIQVYAGKPMLNLRCEIMRQWFRELTITEWNAYIPYIRKRVTERHGPPICPPQLSAHQHEIVLRDFNIAMNAYEKIIKKRDVLDKVNKDEIRNKSVYEYTIMKILCYRMKGDPRLPALLECIHFQSKSTIDKNDIIWECICKKINMEYEQTRKDHLLSMIA